MLEALQAWVADYYTRAGPWSYEEHRRIFDGYTGKKVEYREQRGSCAVGTEG